MLPPCLLNWTLPRFYRSPHPASKSCNEPTALYLPNTTGGDACAPRKNYVREFTFLSYVPGALGEVVLSASGALS